MRIGRGARVTLLLAALTIGAIGVAVFDWLAPERLVHLPIRNIAATLLAVLVA